MVEVQPKAGMNVSGVTAAYVRHGVTHVKVWQMQRPTNSHDFG